MNLSCSLTKLYPKKEISIQIGRLHYFSPDVGVIFSGAVQLANISINLFIPSVARC